MKPLLDLRVNSNQFLSVNARVSGLVSLIGTVGPAANADPLAKFVPVIPGTRLDEVQG
jgi:hypothetical protein